MNIGILELIFAFIMFCLIWFIIYKFKIAIGKKKSAKNIIKNLEKQDKKFFIEGKEVDLKKELQLKIPKPKKKKNASRKNKKKNK